MTDTFVKGFDIEYNTQKADITISEYGRGIQEMIIKATELEDDEHRQEFVEAIVELMLRMHPQTKNVEDYVEKIWRHVFRIAKYNLKGVKTPSGKMPSKEEDRLQPDKVPYPTTEPKYRHYGHNVQELIKKAIAMEDGPIKTEFVKTIGNYMKMAYMTWNKEHFVNDNIILDDLKALSKGQLTIEENISLDKLADSNKRKGKQIVNISNTRSPKRFSRNNNNKKRKFK